MLPQSWLGKKIGNRYQIEMLLGQGGMSAVYRAIDPNLRRIVAIKLIHPHLSVNPMFIDRFKEEAAAVARLRHPNIVQVHDFNWDGENYYMVMEYLEGETLQARLKRLSSQGRFLSIPEALQICIQICNAAGYAHNHDLIHRDIKPANVMLDLHGQAILMDFGIVKIVGGEYHTATGATVGTAMYMSPEQIRSERVDERSDIYSLGVTLYEMLSGRPPYQADSVLTLMMMVLNDPLPDLCEFRKGIPKELQAVVERALSKDPAKRFKTMAEMAAALQQVQSHLEIPVPATTSVDETELEPAEPQILLAQSLTKVDASSSESLELLPDSQQISVSSAVDVLPIEHVTIPSETAVPEARSKTRLGSKHYIVAAVVVFLVMVVVIGVNQIMTAIRPPPVQLAPITRPSIPITAETSPFVVNLGRWETASIVEELAYSPDGAFLGTANDRDWVRFSKYRHYSSLWGVETGSVQYLLGHNQPVNSVAFSPEGDLFASASDDGTLILWKVSDGSLVRKIEPSIGGFTSVRFSPNKMLLAASSWDGIVGLWQVSDGQLLRTMRGPEIAIKDAEFSPDGKLLAAASEDNTILLWRVSDGNLMHTLQGHSGMVYRVAFSPDGALLASASEDGTIKLWQVGDGDLVKTLQGLSDPVYDVVFSPDGSLLASGSMDKTLRLWQVSDWQVSRIVGEHMDGILSVIFSPDGRLLVSGSADGQVYFWGISEAIPVEAGATPAAP